MPKVPIDEYPAGESLNTAIAMQLGWRYITPDSIDYPTYKWTFWIEGEGWYKRTKPHNWSGDITTAWELVLDLTSQPAPDDTYLQFSLSMDHKGLWWARFGHNPGIEAETPELAISRAFLKAHIIEDIEIPEKELRNPLT